MKKKTDNVLLLDDLRNQDPKKRFISIQSLRQIGQALGPIKARTEFLQYLTQFIDDEQYLVLELLNQLQNFSDILGGQEHLKNLLPLLIGFCKTDEKKQAQKSALIIQKILRKNKQLIVDTVKKLAKAEMNTAKQSACKLTSTLIPIVPQNENQLLQIYSGMVFSDIPSFKIIASKYLPKLLDSVKNKEQIGKMLEVIYNDVEDLPKIYALEALINYYNVNNNFVFLKFKALFMVNNWRLNIKICQNISLAFKVFSKAHFKTTFETNILKFLISNEPQLRAKSCLVIKSLASIMTQQDVKQKLMVLVKNLINDPVNFVKVQMSENIVSLMQVCSTSIISDQILPIIFSIIKSNQLAVGIIKNFDVMSKKVSNDKLQQKIMTPLISQFNTDNWRTKCQLIELLGNVICCSFFLNEKMTNLLIGLLSDRINAVRQKACQLIINVICQQSPQWSDTMLITKLNNLRQSNNYNERQLVLQIIQKTSQKVSEKTLNDVYKATLLLNLNDKIPNVRAKALRVLKGNKKLYDKNIEKYVEKLKNDTDSEVKELAISVLTNKA